MISRLPAILLCLALVTARSEERATVPEKVINLLAPEVFRDLHHHIDPKRSVSRERDEVWALEKGLLHVTGKGWGYLRTAKAYRDYHAVMEYRWGERIYGHREDKCRDNGLMVHGYGPDGAFGNMFLSSFQAQLLEGASGDLIALAARDAEGKPAPTSMKAKVGHDRDGEPVWDPEGTVESFPAENQIAGRLNWRHRDPGWRDVRGFRGEKDIENPVGEWNRLEVICRGDTITIRLNGEKVNEAFDVSPAQGFVCLQSEAAQTWIRRLEIWPLDRFDEEWKEEFRSTDTGYRTDGESILPRRFPWNPEQSREAWKVHEGYEMQLVASEPLVNDPVDVVWDEEGRMFVAEMRDYPLPAEGGEYLSRIRLLRDEDGDGVMDSAATWADRLDHVQGLLPMNGGLVATTRNAILFLKDTDGDGRADLRKKLFEQNEPRHNQLQVSSPRWGLDHAIYFNNGLDLKEIYPAESSGEKIQAASRNLRFDPYRNELQAISGRGQFGGALDNWNRRYFSTNRNPIIHAIFPVSAARRNPFAAITQLQADLDEQAAKLRPVSLSHTTSVAHAGTYTAACGIAIYRGGLMPEMVGDALVCDPTAQVVTRSRLEPRGAAFEAVRIGEKYEFLASADEWTRPVNLRNGPDGALYICDMYRRFIDHARFFPEEFSKTNYMRAGLDQGRIWRLVPTGKKAPPIAALPGAPGELVGLLEHPNAWQRIHAQRLLAEKEFTDGVSEILKTSQSPEARVHAFWLLEGQGKLTEELLLAALGDGHDGVVENTIQRADPVRHAATLIHLAQTRPGKVAFHALLKLGDNPAPEVTALFADYLFRSSGRVDDWTRKGILSGCRDRAGTILSRILTGKPGDVSPETFGEESLRDTIREFATATAARGDAEELAAVLDAFNAGGARRFEFAEGLSAGLRRSPLKQKSLAAFIASPPPGLEGKTDGLQRLVASSRDTVLNRELPVRDRLAALPLAGQQAQDVVFAMVEKLIEQVEPAEIQAAACRALTRFKRTEVADFFFERWNTLAPTPRREALNLIATNATTGLTLMKKMKAGEIPSSIMPPMQRWSYGRSRNEEIRSLAEELFGKSESNRAKVIQSYRKGIAGKKGNPEKGKLVFQKAACFTCHRMGDTGVQVGPSLADVRIKPEEALLTDILDPNRAVEERWASYQVDTKDGKSFLGLIQSETRDAIRMIMPGGHTETISRTQIAQTNSSGLSLMPVGLEGAISPEDMADLLAFLKQ